MTDNEGKSALDFAQDNPKVSGMLNRFLVESRQRFAECKSSDNHSFDDEDFEHPHSKFKPFGLEEDQPIFASGGKQADLSSWESSQDEDLVDQGAASGIKHSPGMMDLSKFLTPSDQSGKFSYSRYVHHLIHSTLSFAY